MTDPLISLHEVGVCYRRPHGFFKGSAAAFANIGKALHLDKETFNTAGFTQMMFLDPIGFDQQHLPGDKRRAL